jgi:hypothetical protein
MADKIDITVDDKVVRDALKESQKQAPFALSLAVNNVTKDAQVDLKAGVQSRFILRRPDFVLREAAKITKFSTKADPHAIIQVSDKADFLAKFEDGGTKSPRDGRAIAIPLNVRRSKTDIIPKSQRPPALYASKSAQAGRVFSKSGLLLQRVGRGARAAIRVLYVWKSSVKVDARLQFKKTANNAVDKQWTKRALEAVDKALASMR